MADFLRHPVLEKKSKFDLYRKRLLHKMTHVP